MSEITNHPIYLEILADSFGGIMYDVANKNKYDAVEIISMWDVYSESEKESANGIIKGVFDFLLN